MRSAAVTTGAGHANRVDRVQLVALVERAKPDQAGLVTVTIGDITRGDILIDITVPVSGAVNLAANVCGVSVDVITADLAPDGFATCGNTLTSRSVRLTR